MKRLLAGIILGLAVFILTGFVLGGKTEWEYKVGFLLPEEKAILHKEALKEWEELGIESEEFREFCERFYPQGLTPETQLQAWKSFREFRLQQIRKKGIPTFAERKEFLETIAREGWELIAIETHTESGLPVGYFKRKRKGKEAKREEKEETEPVTPFEFHERETGH